MDDEQQFNLRWHNHQNNVIGALGRMYSAGILTDVTLSANGATVRAHRLVLASCSQYFAQLFKEVEGDNTLVIVLGCEPNELRLLLSFMYTGEVTASKRTLPSLLRLARALKVAGLTDADCSNPASSPMETERNDENNQIETPINLETIKADTPIFSPLDAGNIRFNFDDFSNNNSFDNTCMLTNPVDSLNTVSNDERLSRLDKIVQNLYSTHKLDTPLLKVPVTSPAANNFEDRPTPYERKYRDGSVCTICSKRLSNQYNLRVHMETHSGARHACTACSHVSRSRDALRKHVAYRHPDKMGNRNVEKQE